MALTQYDRIRRILNAGNYSIQEIQDITGFKRPSIRRVVGRLARSGEFLRTAKGEYETVDYYRRNPRIVDPKIQTNKDTKKLVEDTDTTIEESPEPIEQMVYRHYISALQYQYGEKVQTYAITYTDSDLITLFRISQPGSIC